MMFVPMYGSFNEKLVRYTETRKRKARDFVLKQEREAEEAEIRQARLERLAREAAESNKRAKEIAAESASLAAAYERAMAE